MHLSALDFQPNFMRGQWFYSFGMEMGWKQKYNFVVAVQDALAVTELEKFTWKNIWNNIYCGECGLSTGQGVF